MIEVKTQGERRILANIVKGDGPCSCVVTLAGKVRQKRNDSSNRTLQAQYCREILPFIYSQSRSLLCLTVTASR